MNGKIVIGIMALFVITTASLTKAQQPGKVARIGYVSATGIPDANFDELRQGLRDLGHVENKNIAFEYRGAQGKQELISGFVAELLQLKVDLLFCPNLPAIHAAKDATKSVPIVIVSNVDPVELGLVSSFARPGGNI